jgi:archaellum component FlaC
MELKLEAQGKQIQELRELVLELSKQINSLTIEVNYLSNEKYKYGKSI